MRSEPLNRQREDATSQAPAVETASASPEVAAPFLPQVETVLALQRTAGNRSVTGLLARQGAPPDAPPPLPSAAILTNRLAQSIGVWETNRGGDEPNPTESRLRTVSGIRASMATIEQATMPYAIDALRQHAALRARAEPPLTMAELNAAAGRTNAVRTLMDQVQAAANAGTAADDWIDANDAVIAPTGLDAAHVRTMFEAVDLRATIGAAHTRVAAGNSTAAAEAAAVPAEDRLGLNEASLRTYIRNTRTWGENRAAWQRLAVQRMADDVGQRIEAVAVADDGTALAAPVIHGRVDAQLAQDPQPTEEQLVRTVGGMNNPGEANYGANVWATYQRLFPAPEPDAAPAPDAAPEAAPAP